MMLGPGKVGEDPSIGLAGSARRLEPGSAALAADDDPLPPTMSDGRVGGRLSAPPFRLEAAKRSAAANDPPRSLVPQGPEPEAPRLPPEA